jgi:hypothetical protein
MGRQALNVTKKCPYKREAERFLPQSRRQINDGRQMLCSDSKRNASECGWAIEVGKEGE